MPKIRYLFREDYYGPDRVHLSNLPGERFGRFQVVAHVPPNIVKGAEFIDVHVLPLMDWSVGPVNFMHVLQPPPPHRILHLD